MKSQAPASRLTLVSSPALLTPKLSTTAKFLSALDPTADKFTFQTFADGKGVRSCITATKAATLRDAELLLTAANRAGSGVFVTVNAMDTSKDGRTAADFRRVRAIWCDLDDGLPDAPWPIAPSMIVQSSPAKFHVYWLVSDDMPTDTFAGIMARLVQDWRSDRNAVDLPRVLRLPGFWHRKGAALMVELAECHPERRYTTAELALAFPPIAREVVAPGAMSMPRASNDNVGADYRDARSALTFLADKTLAKPDADGTFPLCVDDRATWINFGMALKREFADDGFDLWDEWSAHSASYDASDMQRRWDGFSYDAGGRTRGVTMGSVFHLARHHGWAKSPFGPIDAEPDPTFTPGDGLTALRWAQRVTDWTSENVGELLQRMSREHAFVADGPRYTWKKSDGELALISPDQMRQMYAGIYEHDNRRRTAFHAFEAWSGRPLYDAVGFYPGSDMHPAEVPDGHLNTWAGLAVQPVEGDWSLLKGHLLAVICGGNADHERFLLDWMAQAVQQPQRKPGCAVVLVGSQKGSGKSTVSKVMQSIFGAKQSASISQMSHITGNFNGHLERAVFVGIEEGFWAGNKQANGTIKDLITSDALTYEAKGRDGRTGANYSRFMFTSNEDRAVFVDQDERRYFVLNVRHPEPTKAGFDALHTELKNGGTAAFLHHLLEREITSDFYRPPETGALRQLRETNLDEMTTAFVEIAKDGMIRGEGVEQPLQLSSSAETEIETEELRSAIALSTRGWSAHQLPRRIGAFMSALGIERRRVRRSAGRTYVYPFPPLGEFRAALSKRIGIDINHDDADDDDNAAGLASHGF